MRAVNFDFLSSVSVVENNEDSILVELSSTVNQEPCSIIAECPVLNNVEMIDTMIDFDPQNAVPIPYNVQSVKEDTVLTVVDFDNIHAIEGMPFRLTPQQVIDLNNILYDQAEQV